MTAPTNSAPTREQIIQLAKQSWLGDTVWQWFEERYECFAKFYDLARADLSARIEELEAQLEQSGVDYNRLVEKSGVAILEFKARIAELEEENARLNHELRKSKHELNGECPGCGPNYGSCVCTKEQQK